MIPDKFRKNSVFLMGDSHSYSHTLSNLYHKFLYGEDVVFLGDGGEGFLSIENDLKWVDKINNLCKKNDIRLFCIRGNHSNPALWNEDLDKINVFSNVFFTPDYTRIDFPNGKKALLIGGGISIDRLFRKEGVDYFPEERTKYKQINEKIDVLFSHDAPEYFNHSTSSLREFWGGLLAKDNKLFNDCLVQRGVISKIVKDTGVSRIYSGHFHNSARETAAGVEYRCLDINEVLFFDSDSLDIL